MSGWSAIPPDILSVICSYLNNKEVFQLSTVCKNWRLICFKNLKKLYITKKDINDDYFIELLKSTPNLKLLNIYACQQLTDKGYIAIENLNNLESLNTTFSFISPDRTMSILKKNNKLRRLYSTTPLSAYTEELMNLRWRKMNQSMYFKIGCYSELTD